MSDGGSRAICPPQASMGVHSCVWEGSLANIISLPTVAHTGFYTRLELGSTIQFSTVICRVVFFVRNNSFGYYSRQKRYIALEKTRSCPER